MKVTFIVYNIYGIGGTVRTVVNTANYLVNNGYDVSIMSIKKTFDTPKFEIDKQVKLVPLLNTRKQFSDKSFKSKMAASINKLPSLFIDRNELLYKNLSLYTDILLIKALKNLKSDVVISTFPSLNFFNAKYVNKNVVKIGQEHAQLSAHHNTIKRKIKRYYNELDCLTVLTPKEQEDYEAFLDQSIDIKVIPNGINNTEFKTDYSNKVIVSAGRFVFEKGYERLISLYEPIAKKYPDWELRIYGSGNDFNLMLDTIFEKGIYNNVFLYPNTPLIMEELSKSSIFVLPSRFESFGMVVIEAMSVGLPVISYDTYGPTNIIEDSVDGFVVPMDDEKEFQEKLEQLIENHDLLEQMGENAKVKSKSYLFENIGSLWDNLLKSFR
ncbi:glycosyltransferase family 4 protein [Enterococcus casseliflavus]|jgi:Glycosyltransferase|uniref:glycosyltransferase family 4 protein n=1 Tax=Enterococcus TaxID=1350 RepID=UPI000DFF7F1B|nr:glycosyltransferase family 4 protein [Enterococcus casseliflavus]MDB1692637.1 glycosyltransferase family 4 protein [Enterococcus casseliflavus]GEB27881.1 hypothetical protein ECA02_09760 [Enterococcus casseliflavus]STP35965.1 glycosyltransferase, putative [Enterococcus casseliflavus]